MMRPFILFLLLSTVAGATAHANPPGINGVTRLPSVAKPVPPTIVQAGFVIRTRLQEDEALPAPVETIENPSTDITFSDGLTLRDLTELTLQRNPRLAQVGWAVQTARGRALQAGLYPNPTVSITGNEISDRTGPAGIWSAYASQEIVTAHKLQLSRATILREVDQASLELIAERYEVFTEVRQAFFEAVMMQHRVAILRDLVALAERSVGNANELMKAKESAELDVVQLEVDLERYRADLDATIRALPAAYERLAASVGVQEMVIPRLAGDLNTPLPHYNLDQVRLYMLGVHPQIRAAEFGVQRARLALRRAEVEPIPNVTVGSGYTYQGQNRSSDWDIGVSVPLPFWNKNQGNILAAQAQVNEAVQQVTRVENELVNEMAVAFATYASARERSERYKTAILPRAQRTFDLSRRGYQGGQFEYLRVLEAQRAVAEAHLELVRSLGEMWQSASEIAGLTLEDDWPPALAQAISERELP